MRRQMIARWMILTMGLLAFVMLGGQQALADEKPDGHYKNVVTLLDATENIIGQPLVYPEGNARLTALVITLQPGDATGWHKHRIPVFAYILEGEARVDYGDGESHSFKAGEAFLEAVDHWHDGKIISDKPAKILAVFIGAEGLPKVVKKPE